MRLIIILSCISYYHLQYHIKIEYDIKMSITPMNLTEVMPYNAVKEAYF